MSFETTESQQALAGYYAQDEIVIPPNTFPPCPHGLTNITAIAPVENFLDPNSPICNCPLSWNCDYATIVARSLPLACSIR